MREFFHVLHGCGHLVRRFYCIQHGQHYLLGPSWVESLGFSFPGTSLNPLFCLSRRTNLCKPDSFVNVLEECDPVVLVLILMLVLVGQLAAGACGSKKSVLQSFLIFYLSFIKLWGKSWGNDDVARSFNFSRGTWVHTHKKHQETEIRFHLKWEFDSTTLKKKLCFHSTQNKILFPLHSKQNYVFLLHSKQNSVSSLPYSINPNKERDME